MQPRVFEKLNSRVWGYCHEVRVRVRACVHVCDPLTIWYAFFSCSAHRVTIYANDFSRTHSIESVLLCHLYFSLVALESC